MARSRGDASAARRVGTWPRSGSRTNAMAPYESSSCSRKIHEASARIRSCRSTPVSDSKPIFADAVVAAIATWSPEDARLLLRIIHLGPPTLIRDGGACDPGATDDGEPAGIVAMTPKSDTARSMLLALAYEVGLSRLQRGGRR